MITQGRLPTGSPLFSGSIIAKGRFVADHEILRVDLFGVGDFGM